jgi:hypothetical protein
MRRAYCCCAASRAPVISVSAAVVVSRWWGRTHSSRASTRRARKPEASFAPACRRLLVRDVPSADAVSSANWLAPRNEITRSARFSTSMNTQERAQEGEEAPHAGADRAQAGRGGRAAHRGLHPRCGGSHPRQHRDHLVQLGADVRHQEGHGRTAPKECKVAHRRPTKLVADRSLDMLQGAGRGNLSLRSKHAGCTASALPAALGLVSARACRPDMLHPASGVDEALGQPRRRVYRGPACLRPGNSPPGLPQGLPSGERGCLPGEPHSA